MALDNTLGTVKFPATSCLVIYLCFSSLKVRFLNVIKGDFKTDMCVIAISECISLPLANNWFRMLFTDDNIISTIITFDVL